MERAIQVNQDNLLTRGLYYNLRALLELHQSDIFTTAQVLESLKSAEKSIITYLNGQDVLKTHAGRYLSQIRINQAQLHVVNNPTKAIGILRSTATYLKEFAPDYLPELVSELALTHYYAEQYLAAIRGIREAFISFFHVGDVLAMRTCREIAIACFTKLDKADLAEETFQLLDSDPLGFLGIPINESLYKDV